MYISKGNIGDCSRCAQKAEYYVFKQIFFWTTLRFYCKKHMQELKDKEE